MNCGKWLLFSLLMCFFATGFAQNIPSLSPLNALMSTDRPVHVNWHSTVFNITDSPFNTFPHQLLKTKNGLFVFVNGTGRLYHLRQNDGFILPERLDSTIVFGYNFGSFPFVYHDTIYSLGGYGIWRINGQLRAYVPEAHAWDVVPLNEEVPVLMQDENDNMLWYDPEKGMLYIAYSLQRNQAVKQPLLNDETFDYRVRCLDLSTKEWSVKGTLNSYFSDKISLVRDIAFTPWGQLITFGNKFLLLDFSHNQLLHLPQEIENRVRSVLFQHPTNNLYYCVDSTLYFGNIAENRLQSMQLHRNEFIESEIRLYTSPVTPFFTMTIVAGAITSIGLASAGLLFRKKKQQRSKRTPLNPEQQPATNISTPETNVLVPEAVSDPLNAKPAIVFTEKEWRVIQLIAGNSRKGIATSVDELNRLLGLTNATPNSQKSQRSQLFKSINEKCFAWKNANEELIQSRSQQGDARYKEYFIASGKLAEIESLLSPDV